MKYDDYLWHYNGEFPRELPSFRAATHIGIYFCWCLDNDLICAKLWNLHPEELMDVKKRKLTGSQFLLYHYKGKLISDYLSSLGNSFTQDYYEEDGIFAKKVANYFSDYSQSYHLAADQDLYHVVDTWENYFLIQDVLDHRFEQWQKLTHNK